MKQWEGPHTVRVITHTDSVIAKQRSQQLRPFRVRFFSLSLTSIFLHSTAPHRSFDRVHILALLLHSAELLHTARTISLRTKLLISHTSPSLGPYRATSISVPRMNFSFLLFSAINSALPGTNPSLKRSVSQPARPVSVSFAARSQGTRSVSPPTRPVFTLDRALNGSGASNQEEPGPRAGRSPCPDTAA